MFKDVNSKIDFPSMEKAILNWWDNQGILKTYLQRNKDASKRFSFIDGPILRIILWVSIMPGDEVTRIVTSDTLR